MEKDDSGSIFDRPSDWSKKRRPLKKKRREPVAPYPSQSANPPTEMQPSSGESAGDMIKRMREMQDDLDGKVLDLYSKIGLARTYAQDFFGDPRNSQSYMNTAIQNQLVKLENQLGKILGNRIKKVSQGFKAAKEGEKRKKKFVGQRRKWLQM